MSIDLSRSHEYRSKSSLNRIFLLPFSKRNLEKDRFRDRTDRESQDDTSFLPTDFSNTQRSFLGRCLSILRSLDNNHLEFILNIFSSHTDRTLVPHCSLLLVVWLSPCYCLPFLRPHPRAKDPPRCETRPVTLVRTIMWKFGSNVSVSIPFVIVRSLFVRMKGDFQALNNNFLD